MDQRDKDGVRIADWDRRYRLYQATLARRYLIPALKRWGVGLDGMRLLEVGSGDGGCSAEFARSHCAVTAVDIDARLVAIASALDVEEGVEVAAFVGDACDPECPALERAPFDVVLLRDVVEHLEDLDGALRIVSASLRRGGVALVVFPPYFSPYGAHQQILPRRALVGVPVNKLPYIQLLPKPWFGALTRSRTTSGEEVARLSAIRLTLNRFERTVRDAGMRIRARKFYLSRPTYALRYRAPVIGASFLGRVPGLRELVVTAGYYLLEREIDRSVDRATT